MWTNQKSDVANKMAVLIEKITSPVPVTYCELQVKVLKSVILWLCYLLASVYNFKRNPIFKHHFETFNVLIVQIEKCISYFKSGCRLQGKKIAI